MKMNTFHRIFQNKTLYFCLVAAVLLTVSFVINFNNNFTVNDPDGFYHIRHAWLYGFNGIFDTSFPWVQYSVIRTFGGDLWYGFHLFLVPFTFIPDLIWAIKIAGVSITFLTLLCYFFSLHRLKLKFALFWSVLPPFSIYIMLERLTLARPHSLSIGLNALLFSYFIQGNVWPIFLISFLLSFIHINLFWVPILALIVISIVRLMNNEKLETNKAMAMITGLLAGIFFRPHPIGTLKINYVQLIDSILQRIKGINLSFGDELFPMGILGLPSYVLIIFMILSLMFFWLFKKHQARIFIIDKISALSSMILMTLYLILAIFVARRAVDFFIEYFILFAAINFTYYFEHELTEPEYSIEKIKILKTFTLAMIVSLASYNGLGLLNSFCSYLDQLSNPYMYRNSMQWLEKNTKPGEIIFHIGWASFPELFFWNQNDHYINGMDPIFMYKYDPKLYWEYHFLSNGQGTDYTCGNRKCTQKEAVLTYDVLLDDFKASYFVVLKRHNQTFQYLSYYPKRYKMVFFDGEVVIFKILPKTPTLL